MTITTNRTQTAVLGLAAALTVGGGATAVYTLSGNDSTTPRAAPTTAPTTAPTAAGGDRAGGQATSSGPTSAGAGSAPTAFSSSSASSTASEGKTSASKRAGTSPDSGGSTATGKAKQKTSSTKAKVPAPETVAVAANPDDAPGAPAPRGGGSGSDTTGTGVSAAVERQNTTYTKKGKSTSGTLRPNRVLIPKIGKNLTVVSEPRKAGFLSVPLQAWRIGWDQQTSPLSASTGSTVIAGHNVLAGAPGPFAQLRRLGAGDVIWTSDSTGTKQAWRTISKTSYGKKSLPADLFMRAGERRLVLITCTGPIGNAPKPGGGTYRGYTKNEVLVATPVGGAR